MSSESEIQAKLLLLHTQSKIWAQKWMNLQSTAIAGCRNPLKPCFESEIRAKIFSNLPIHLPIHPPHTCSYVVSGVQGWSLSYMALSYTRPSHLQIKPFTVWIPFHM